MASQLLHLTPTSLAAKYLQFAVSGVPLVILTSFFSTSRGEDMIAADRFTMLRVFIFSLITRFLFFLFVRGRRLPSSFSSFFSSSSNHECNIGLLFSLFKASVIYSALVSLLCILLPEHLSWKAYVTFLLGIVAVLALKTFRATRPHEIVLPLDRVITQNWEGLEKFLYKEAFLLLLTSFLNTSPGQAMLAAEDHLTMVHVFVLSLLGMLFFLSILEPELPFTYSSNHYWINKLLVVLFEALLASAVVSVLCILLPDYLRRKAYTCFMLGVAAVLAYDGFTSDMGTSMLVIYCPTIL